MAPEELDPNKFHVLDKSMQIKVMLIALFALLIGSPLAGYFYYNFAIHRPSQTANEKTVEIRGGETISDIAAKLYREDTINSEFLFKVYIAVNNLQSDVQAGVYVIPGGTSLNQLVEMLQHGTNDKVITFLEGWRLEEIAKHASLEFDKIDYEDFIKQGKTYEGMLFPDTYIFNVEITEKALIDELTDTFNIKTQDILTDENLAKTNLTRDEALIFASIVEREVRTLEDKKIVAGILIKRWQNGDLIGADATTQYIAAKGRYGCDIDSKDICPGEDIPEVQWWPNDLTQNELDINNQYNTRALVGLPPKPISNPSVSSIEAVINYQQTNYYFYLNDSEGNTHFSETLDEHNRNVAKYL